MNANVTFVKLSQDFQWTGAQESRLLYLFLSLPGRIPESQMTVWKQSQVEKFKKKNSKLFRRLYYNAAVYG